LSNRRHVSLSPLASTSLEPLSEPVILQVHVWQVENKHIPTAHRSFSLHGEAGLAAALATSHRSTAAATYLATASKFCIICWESELDFAC
jgi:hypothetical protein